MSVEFSPTVVRPRFPAISWSAIFAALAVGLAVQLVLSLAGIALGVYTLEAGDGSDTITLAAASWASVSMLVSAMFGGYVAGRSSGLRRTGDGVLHGVVAWAVTTLLYTALATSAVGAVTTGLFGLVGSSLEGNGMQAAVGAAGDRERALEALTDLGLSAERARAVLDQVVGGASRAAGGGTPADTADAVGSATVWLSAAVLLSLLLAVLGGIIGVRGSRRIVRRERDPVAPRPRILSRS